MNAGASTYTVPSPIEGSGTAWVLLGSWALSPARPTPIHPRHECRGFSAFFGDLNSDLLSVPYDTEFEGFIIEVRNLIIPIMEAIQTYGLKKRHLHKFQKPVDNFYQQVIMKRYTSELTTKYQDRFRRYQDSLFTFLQDDGIPWHNNTAERAIRHLARQRDISGSFHESGARDYLTLLGIRQTCRSQGKSFFKFLFSGETDLEKFEARKRKQSQVMPQ